MSGLTIYTLASCDTCRKATKWLKGRGLGFVEKPIRETPPAPHELRAMLTAHGGDIRRLFNTAGEDFRAAGLGEKLPGLSVSAALALLAKNGRLVKRPFLIGPDVALVGWNEAAWTAALGKK